MNTAHKAEHVKNATQTRKHSCHWPGCEIQVPPAMWGCKTHWFTLPTRLRALIWINYEPGQEETLTPSPRYIAAAREIQRWITQYENSRH